MSDIQIVAIVVILAASYGTFIFMYANDKSLDEQHVAMPDVNYTEPNAGNFMSTIDEIGKINVDNPEIFFVNSILFTTIEFMLVFIGLRYLRGTG